MLPHACAPHSLSAGLRTLSLQFDAWQQLPPALLQATQLQQLDLWGNLWLRSSEAELRQLLQALPKLQLLDLEDTGIDEGTSATLKVAAAARGLMIQLPDLTQTKFQRHEARLQKRLNGTQQ